MMLSKVCKFIMKGAVVTVLAVSMTAMADVSLINNSNSQGFYVLPITNLSPGNPPKDACGGLRAFTANPNQPGQYRATFAINGLADCKDQKTGLYGIGVVGAHTGIIPSNNTLQVRDGQTCTLKFHPFKLRWSADCK